MGSRRTIVAFAPFILLAEASLVRLREGSAPAYRIGTVSVRTSIDVLSSLRNSALTRDRRGQERRRRFLAAYSSTGENVDIEESWRKFRNTDTIAGQKWYANLELLRAYERKYGDCAIGYRDDDDLSLVAWAKEQRLALAKGSLDRVQKAELDAIGFRWKSDYFDDQAEWLQMYAQLKEYAQTYGTLQISPISSLANVHLMHWTHIQRELAKGGVLPEKRKAMLKDLGFEFDGPAGSNH